MPFGYAAAAGTVLAGVNTYIGSNAAKSAASAQEQAAQQSLALQRSMYDTTQQNLAPNIQAGQNALPKLQSMLGIGAGASGSPILAMLGIGPNGQQTGGGINPSTFQGSPGYQYQKQQIGDQITNQMAGQGGSLGGNALIDLQQSASGLANQNWNQYLGNVYQNWQNQLAGTQNLVGSGQNAAVQQGGFGAGMANQASNIYAGIGNSQASGIMGSANALTGGINSIGQGLQTQALLANAPGANPFSNAYTSLYNGITSLGVPGNTGGSPSDPGTNFLQQSGFYNPLGG